MKILVRGTNWIGDSVMSVPALKELRRIFLGAQITLHTRTWADGLFSNADFIDELVTFDKAKWAAKDVYDNSRFLKGDQYDLAVIFPNSFESAATSFLSKIPRRFGYNKDLRGLLLTDAIAVPEWKNRRHEVYYYLNLVSEIEKGLLGRDTVSETYPDTSLPVTEEQRSLAIGILAANGIEGPFVAVGVGSTNSIIKRWPHERFITLINSIVSRQDIKVVLLGSKEESATAEGIISAAGTGVYDLTGKTSLAEAVGILSLADLMISNDMGLAHIAPAVGTPTIALFGPTNPETTRPWGDNVLVLRQDVRCVFCEKGDQTPRHICERWPAVTDVLMAASAILTKMPVHIDLASVI